MPLLLSVSFSFRAVLLAIIYLFLLSPYLCQQLAAAEPHIVRGLRFSRSSLRVNFDQCTTTDQCLLPRRCISLLAQNERICLGGESCFCYARLRCSSTENSICAKNEVCYRGSCESAARHFQTPPIDETQKNVTGESFERCSSDKDCRPDYRCIATPREGVRVACPRDGSVTCNCFSLDSICLSSAQCSPRAFCFRPLGLERAVCVSSSSIQLFEPSSSTSSKDKRNGTLFNFQSCNSTGDCAPRRECIRGSNRSNILCEEPHPGCVCMNQMPMCHVNSFCEPGETCVFHEGLSSAVCKAAKLVEQRDPAHPGIKLSLQGCSYTRECRAPRRCARFAETGLFDECHERSDCFCLDTEYQCFRDDECLENESCQRFANSAACAAHSIVVANSIPQKETENEKGEEPAFEDSDDSLVPIELPPEPTIGVSEGAVRADACVAVKHLQELERNELLFATHRTTKVLCDGKLSCATAGHIVVYRGLPMSMKSYCQHVGCSMNMMEVNSPRYVWGLRMKSHSVELQLTVFAARFETMVEEAFLVCLVRLGL